MTMIDLQKLHPDVKLPSRQTPGSIGLDIHAYIKQNEDRPSKKLIPPHSTVNISTGLLIRAPVPIFVYSRSGLAAHSVFVANAPGIIDPDYRGELRVLLYNGGHSSFWIEHDFRIAQLITFGHPPVYELYVNEVENIPADTERGRKGFGSTGN